MNKNSNEIRKVPTKSAQVPNVRFPGFEGDWNKKPLGKISRMKAGKFVRANDIFEDINDGLYPCYGGNGLRGYTSSFTHYGKYSLIGRQGALCGNVNLVNGRFQATEHAVVVDHNEEFNTDFLFYVLNNLNLNRYATGQAQPGLSVSSIERITFSFPLLPEQTKIANFLTIIDARIQTQNKILEDFKLLKKGLMQKIFKQEIRFKNKDGKEFPKWEIKKLSSLCERIVRKNKEDNKNVLTISAQLGLINQEEYFNKSVSAKNVTGYYLLEKNEFAYNKSYSKGYPMGAIKRLKKYEKGVVSTLYICFKFNIEISLEFMEQYFESGFHNHELSKVTQEGARNHGLLNIAVGDFFNTKLLLPSKQEQQKIAATLSAIDQKITLEEDYLDKLKAQKKYLLQNLFV